MAALTNDLKRGEPWHRASGALLAVLSIFAASAPGIREVHAADPAPDLEIIRAALDSYAAGIKTLDGKFVQKTATQPGPSGFLSGVTVRDRRLETTFLADLVHRLTLLNERASHSITGKDGAELRFESHKLRTFDGSQTCILFHTPVKSPVETRIPADLPMKLNIGIDDAIATGYVPWDFAGLRLFGQGTVTLASLLREPNVSVDGEEDVRGALCLRIVQKVDDTRPIVAWLDPGCEYLPWRIEITHAVAMGPAPAGTWRRTIQFDVLEYRRFPDEAGGDEKWFPVRGEVRTWLRELIEFEVRELKINSAIDPGRFSIHEQDLPDGVLVNLSGQQELFTGGRKDLWEERQRLLDEENAQINVLLEAQAPAHSNQFDGLPIVAFLVKLYYNLDWLTWLLVFVTLGLAIRGGIYHFRNRHGRQR